MDQRDTHSPTQKQYAFRVAGRLGRTTMAAFPGFLAQGEGADTVLVGPISDCSALYGVVSQMENLGLELIEVHTEHCAGHRPGRACAGR
jgi:hypothetical protein